MSRLLTKADFTREFCRQLVEIHGDKNNAAKAVMADCVNIRGAVPGLRTVWEWIDQGLRPLLVGREDPTRSSRIEKLLDKANTPIDAIGSIQGVKLRQWGYAMKGDDGQPVEGVLDSTEISFSPRAPEFPLAQPANPNNIQYFEPPRILKQTRTIVIVSDAQIGYLQDPESKSIEPIHDPIAMQCAQHITAAMDPSEIVFIGDWMDWPFLSRWTQHEEFDAINESIQEGYDQLCKFKAAAREGTKLIMVSGNHDIRPETFLLEHNRKALRVRRAGDTSGWPIFTQPYILRYDDLGISVPGAYPGGEYYILPELVAVHAPPKKTEFLGSVIHGHTHHLTRSTKVTHTHTGRKTHFMYDVGCLCQVGTTEDPRRLMRTRVPSNRGRTDWAQGIAVVNVVESTGFFSVEQISIQNGVALYGGQIFDGN